MRNTGNKHNYRSPQKEFKDSARRNEQTITECEQILKFQRIQKFSSFSSF